MYRSNPLLVWGVAVLLSLSGASTWGQVHGGLRGGRGTRIGSPILRSNPIVNPDPSVTPHEVLNPWGSLSTGQVINPAPSLNRPRSGGTLPGTSILKPTKGAKDQSPRQLGSADTVTQPAAPAAIPAGETILESVVALDGQIAKVAPEKGWSKRLSLDELRTVPVYSEQPAGGVQRTALEMILKTYQAIATDDQSKSINQLPEFKQTISALQNYLTPIDVRRQKQTASSLQQLANELRTYKNGSAWVKHLISADLTTADKKFSISDAQAKKLLHRFDKLAGNPDYQKVTSLPGFGPSHNALKAIVGQTKP